VIEDAEAQRRAAQSRPHAGCGTTPSGQGAPGEGSPARPGRGSVLTSGAGTPRFRSAVSPATGGRRVTARTPGKCRLRPFPELLSVASDSVSALS